MKHCTKFCCGFWPFIIIPALILLVAIAVSWRSIEKDVASNANTALDDAGFDGIEAENFNNGRDIRLHGTASSEGEKDAAIAKALSANGVRVVMWNGSTSKPSLLASTETPSPTPPTLTPLQPAKLNIKKSSNTLLVSGVSGSSLSASQLGGTINLDEYALDESFTKQARLIELLDFLLSLDEEVLEIEINNRELAIKGTVDALGKSRLYEFHLSEIFDGKVVNLLQVELPGVQEKELITNNECQDKFNQLTANNSINFEVSKSTVLPESYGLLDEFTQLTRLCPSAHFQVVGHTDNTGDSEMNIVISLERAKQVIKHMVNSGVDESRFMALGFGAARPIADNSSDEGRAKNRRVEFKLFENHIPSLKSNPK